MAAQRGSADRRPQGSTGPGAEERQAGVDGEGWHPGEAEPGLELQKQLEEEKEGKM